MPDLKEVFEMVTKQTEPDLGSWNDQERRQRRSGRNRKIGAFAVVAAVLAVAAIVAISQPRQDRTTDVGIAPRSPSGRFFLDLSTGATRPLPESIPEAGIYAVSPDGTMIAGAPCCDPPSPVWVADLDGTDVREITAEGTDGSGPRWSPDASMLVYQERDASTQELGNLVVVDVATGERRQITDLPEKSYGLWFLSPTFTSDGRSILFQLPKGQGITSAGWDIWTVPVGGGEPTLVRRDASMGASSPDGGSLVYLNPSPDDWTSPTLFLADADGRGARILARGEEIEFPRWSPSGSMVAFVDRGGVYVVDVATGEASRVSDGGRAEWLGEESLLISPAPS